jgi:hypothetical protein
MRWIALAALASACGGSALPPPKAPKKEAPVDERAAEKGAKALVGEIYQTIGSGDTDGLMSLLVDPLVVFGPRRGDAMGTRADALVALREHIDPRKNKPDLKSEGLEVVTSPGGHSAWVFDTLDVAGKPMALTAILTNADDMWQVDAATLAATPSMKSIRAQLRKDAIVPNALKAAAKVDGDAKAAVDKFTRGLADQQVWGDDLGSRSDAVVIGPATGDITRGKTDIKKMWKKRVKANTRDTAAGDVTASVTPDGELAWVSAPVVRFMDDDDPLPLRVFAVYEKAGGEWRMIALQEALAVDAPGAGVTYRKTQPPALAKAVAAPVPAAKPADVPKKKPKKIKRKKADDDDETPKKKTDDDDDDKVKRKHAADDDKPVRKKTDDDDDDKVKRKHADDDDKPLKKKTDDDDDKVKRKRDDDDDKPVKRKTDDDDDDKVKRKHDDDDDRPAKKKTDDDDDKPVRKKKKKPVDDDDN